MLCLKYQVLSPQIRMETLLGRCSKCLLLVPQRRLKNVPLKLAALLVITRIVEMLM